MVDDKNNRIKVTFQLATNSLEAEKPLTEIIKIFEYLTKLQII